VRWRERIEMTEKRKRIVCPESCVIRTDLFQKTAVHAQSTTTSTINGIMMDRVTVSVYHASVAASTLETNASVAAIVPCTTTNKKK
jgi:hypothetical protein